MFKGILQLFRGTPKPAREPFHDEVLGQLHPGELGWSVRVSKGGDSFKFSIGGISQPDSRLLRHARDIFDAYESFKSAVRNSVEYESRDYPDELKAVLAVLEIETISLCWPHRPDDGMIFFRGPKQHTGLWRCDYIDRKPVGLGCDT